MRRGVAGAAVRVGGGAGGLKFGAALCSAMQGAGQGRRKQRAKFRSAVGMRLGGGEMRVCVGEGVKHRDLGEIGLGVG